MIDAGQLLRLSLKVIRAVCHLLGAEYAEALRWALAFLRAGARVAYQ
jgi:hypothetical protein